MSKHSPSDEVVLAETREWLEKAVIGLNLCPFAKSVHVKNQVRIVISRATHIDALLEALDEELDLLAEADPETVDTTLIVHPHVLNDFLDYNDFLELADRTVDEHGLEGVIQIASFHPDYQFADTDFDDVGNYSNRSPFPTLHLLREASIDRAVAAFPDAADIFEKNIEMLQKMGPEGWAKLGLKRYSSKS
jgi:hypothetical protein